ncbi:hypothetical protein K461DRAFT_138771 [Myriangium duriaei CBS 260.36]|uniref:Uncharacterized protein n=1 Tax=Myriangium duriaei CBS 260.36 TaxID=1168546 RepID=A0A9P4MN26_9PEZI|nr:hypothetical protein K461DRAFT_138771 [Myriangium duriaei CBS 260.36]
MRDLNVRSGAPAASVGPQQLTLAKRCLVPPTSRSNVVRADTSRCEVFWTMVSISDSPNSVSSFHASHFTSLHFACKHGLHRLPSEFHFTG